MSNENRNSGAGNQLQQHVQLNTAFARATAREAAADPMKRMAQLYGRK
ncbi:hypothetical protein [Microbulbifer sp. A4B17]|nr:hypothetical protein [Microbulbifer sp. A4B17]